MATTTLFTAEDLLAMPANGHSYELIQGELHEMTPGGGFHGYLHSEIASEIRAFVKAHGLGRVVGAETGFLISQNPDTVRAPDAAFVTHAMWDAQVKPEGFLEGAPALAVEVVSPNDRFKEVQTKAMQWLEAGTVLVWVVEPEERTVTIYQQDKSARILKTGEILTGDPVLPGFRLSLAELFA